MRIHGGHLGLNFTSPVYILFADINHNNTCIVIVRQVQAIPLTCRCMLIVHLAKPLKKKKIIENLQLTQQNTGRRQAVSVNDPPATY